MTTLKKIFALVILTVSFSKIAAAQTKPDDILGVWLDQDKASKIEIYKSSGRYFGKIVWAKDGSFNPANYTDSTKAQADMIIVRNFKFNGDDEWEDGKIYDPESKKLYSGKLKLDGKNKLEMRGWIGVSLLGESYYWTRVN
jgi:uncharacterized protein (DUF2147 family)